MKETELILIENNVAVLSPIVENKLDENRQYLEDAKKNDEEFRQAILKAMLDNDIKTAKLGKYTISVVVPHNTIIFDSDKFIEDYLDNTEFLKEFVEYKVQEKPFNLEKFKEEHTDLYKEYTGYDETFEVDTKKLEKLLPQVFEKYSSEVVSTKKTTLTIKEKK